MDTPFGATLRTYRERRGLTQQQLADRAGLGRVTVVTAEAGTQLPTVATLGALAQALGVMPQDLLAGWDGRQP